MTVDAEIAFLFDVDNTLLDNDHFQNDLSEQLRSTYGAETQQRYWRHFETLRSELSYADYLGALERTRLDGANDPTIFRFANWLLDYPFADRLYPDALGAVAHVRQWGPVAILSDGDAVFQPRKIAHSGLWDAFDGGVLIYVHKEKELADVERWRPAKHYVLVDDKVRILKAVKKEWGDRVTTVFPRQGHYALDPAESSDLSGVDLVLEAIGDLQQHDLAALGSARKAS
jgi:FMN phosphatase YigB (HAD superfamily)